MPLGWHSEHEGRSSKHARAPSASALQRELHPGPLHPACLLRQHEVVPGRQQALHLVMVKPPACGAVKVRRQLAAMMPAVLRHNASMIDSALVPPAHQQL